MKASVLLRFRDTCVLLVLALSILSMSGCGGGWGAAKPTIASQSTGQGAQAETVTAGQPATFTVTPAGTGPFTYQWYRNGVLIPGAVSNSYTVTATTGNDNGSVYTVAVSNAAGTTMSAPFSLTVNIPPTITLQPVSQTVTAGQTATFMVTATGTAPLSYQWYQGQTAISGATGSTYTTPATVVGNSGSMYSVIVTNPVGTATSTAATLSVMVVPTLSFNPIPSKTYGDAPFSVAASSASPGPITYSVVSGPATISGNMVTITGAGLVTIMASQGASGNYAAATAMTTFTVAGATPTISFPSPGTQAYSQQPFAVNATSNSPGPITYSVVSGPATIVGNMVTMTGGGAVTLQASQAASGSFGPGTAMTTFTITDTSPQITLQPASKNICPTQTLTLSVTATNATSYQWLFNGTAIAGATNSTLTIGNASVSNTGNYSVTVSNPTQNVTSQMATVNVGSTIVTNPSNLTITEFQEGSFNVAATGSDHYTYQWYSVPFGGTASAISGATSNLYVTPVQTTVTTPGQPTSYYAQVTDTTCNATLQSGQGTLTVDAGFSPPTITMQPEGVTVTANSAAASFTAAAVGSPTVTYQWYVIPNGGTNAEISGATPETGTLIPGATAASYTVPTSSTQTSNDQDVYYMVATNGYGSAVTQHATLAVDQGIQLQITGQPANQYVNPGQSATFAVTATSTASLTYQWYMVPPGESAAVQTTFALQNGTPTQTMGIANAVMIPGATGPSYTVTNTTAAQTGTVYYVVVSNGTTMTVYSNTAALTVGQPSGITACATNWNMLGTTTAGDCSFELTDGGDSEQGEIVWPTLLSTGNMQLSFTIATSNASTPPADGFTMVLGDPSLGATLQSVGLPGEGLGAKGLPGFVLAFDDFFNAACTGSGCFPSPYPSDPGTSSNPDYLGVGRGEPTLWEDPYFNVNTNLPGGADALAEVGQTVSHDYVVTIANGYMSVTMDGLQVFSGNVVVPPVAYLYMTSSTGGDHEETVISNISATVNAPSN
jgi:hypothetical protein